MKRAGPFDLSDTGREMKSGRRSREPGADGDLAHVCGLPSLHEAETCPLNRSP